MVTYAVLDVGMGGLVVVLGGFAVLVFAIIAAVIIRFSVRTIKKEIVRSQEPVSEELTETAQSAPIQEAASDGSGAEGNNEEV